MQLAYDRHDSGVPEQSPKAPPLVLLHGIGSYRGVWRPVVERLAQQREVITIDLPGFGASPPLAAGQTPDVAGMDQEPLSVTGATYAAQ